jgi:hypothetical protein
VVLKCFNSKELTVSELACYVLAFKRRRILKGEREKKKGTPLSKQLY